MRMLISVFLISLLFSFPMVISAQELVVSYEEIVTLTDTEIVITWVTDQPSDTTITYWRDDETQRKSVTLEEDVIYHYCCLQGLEPGTTYHYYTSSGGVQGKPCPRSPGTFTTFESPGKYLFSFATMNDLQVGTAGAFIPGMYLRSAAQSAEWACNDIDDQEVAFVIIKGDITGSGRREELITAKHIFDRLWCPYWVVPSPLDVKPGYEKSRNDTIYKEVFNLNQTYYSFDYEVNGSKFRFICLDSTYETIDLPDIVGGTYIAEEQMEWLEEELEKSAEEGIPAFIFLRHPLQPNISMGMLGSLSYEDSSHLIKLLRQYKNVWGVFSGGYFHRNAVHHSSLLSFPLVETASTVDYPRGYNIYKIYTGGYIQAFYKINDLRATEGSRKGVFLGLGDSFMYGSLSDRNFVWKAK
jgi:hypothetical protein